MLILDWSWVAEKTESLSVRGGGIAIVDERLDWNI
jgi:hypothetical protein